MIEEGDMSIDDLLQKLEEAEAEDALASIGIIIFVLILQYSCCVLFPRSTCSWYQYFSSTVLFCTSINIKSGDIE